MIITCPLSSYSEISKDIAPLTSAFLCDVFFYEEAGGDV